MITRYSCILNTLFQISPSFLEHIVQGLRSLCTEAPFIVFGAPVHFSLLGFQVKNSINPKRKRKPLKLPFLA